MAPATPTYPHVDALAATVWFAEPHRRVWTDDLLSAARLGRAEVVTNATGEPSPAEDGAMTACLATVTPEDGEDEVAAVMMPDGDRRLGEQWSAALHAVADDYGSPADYDGCMTLAGLPVLEGRPFTDVNVYGALTKATPPAADVPVGDGTAGQPWRRLLALETPLVEADWRCRRDVYDEGMSRLAPVVSAFQVAHRAEIGRMQQHWADVEDRARALGWDPETRTVRTPSGR